MRYFLRKLSRMFFIFPVFALTLFLAIVPGQAGAAEEICSGLLAEDPMVRIMSLPISGDMDAILANISKEVSRETGLPQEFITYYWQSIHNINCMGKKTVDYPIFVDLYVPGFLTTPEIKGLMTSIADNIEKFAKIDKKMGFYTHSFSPAGTGIHIRGSGFPGITTRAMQILPRRFRNLFRKRKIRKHERDPARRVFSLRMLPSCFNASGVSAPFAAGGADLGESPYRYQPYCRRRS